MKSEIVFFVIIERILYIKLIAVAVFRDLVEFVPLGVREFFLYLHIVIVLHDKDKIRLLQDLRCHMPRMPLHLIAVLGSSSNHLRVVRLHEEIMHAGGSNRYVGSTLPFCHHAQDALRYC